MSTPTDRLHDPDDPAFYAPKSARAVRLGQVSEAAAALTASLVPEQPRRGADEAIEPQHQADEPVQPLPVWLPRAPLGTEFAAEPLPLRRRSWPALVVRLLLAPSAAAVVALIAVGPFPLPDLWRKPAQDRTSGLALPSSRPAPLAVGSQSGNPQLIVQGSRETMDEPAPLGVTLQGTVDGGVVRINGLIAGMTLSTGEAVNTNTWQVPLAGLGDTWIQPPRNFVGPVQLIAELRLADGTVAHRRSIRLEWMPPPAPPQPKLDPEEIATLLKRGKDLMANGDVAAARLVLLSAAGANDAEAALALAATYDPVALRELGVHGLSADTAMARVWYEKARQLGSAEAPQRLDVLAKGTH